MGTTATRSAKNTRKTTTQTQSVQPTQATMAPAPTRDQIAIRAFEIYMRNNCRPGMDEQNWLQAERELRQESRKVAL